MLDVRCFEDLDLFATEIDDPMESLEQDNHHRIVEPPGSNIDDPEGGLGLEGMLSGELDPSIGALVEAELLKDPRNATVHAIVTPKGSEGLAIDWTIETDEGELEQGVVLGPDGVRRSSS